MDRVGDDDEERVPSIYRPGKYRSRGCGSQEGDEVEIGQSFIKIGAVEKSYSILREYISKFGLVL